VNHPALTGAAVDASTPLLVLRRSLGPFQHGVLGVARSAGRLGIPVYAVRMSQREPATRSRYIRGALDLPRSGDAGRWVEALLSQSEALSGAILLPIDDLAAVAVGDHQDRLGERFRLASQPPGVQRRLASKLELWRLCQSIGLPTPASAFPSSEQEAIDQAEAWGYPVVLKRAEPWFEPRDPSAPSVRIVHSREELREGYARMESDIQPQLMVQSFVPGDSDSVWMFNGYFGADSRCLCGFTGRKLRQRGPRTGPTTLGVCVPNERVSKAATRLMRELDYRGIVDMGFRYDTRDDQYKLLDVNPRLGSTFRLFVSSNGVDVVRALHLDLTGRPVPPATPPDGRTWLDEPGDLLTFAQLKRERAIGTLAWRRSRRNVDERAWWAVDDPLPFVAMSARLVPHALRVGSRRMLSNSSPAEPAHGAPSLDVKAIR